MFSFEFPQSPRHSATLGDEYIYDRPRPLSSNVPSEMPLSVIEEDSFADRVPMEIPDPLLDYGQCVLRGYLFKKEKFMTWVKHFCIIRNNFLECHKWQTQGSFYCPTLKLFLPRSQVSKGGGDVKKKFAFQVCICWCVEYGSSVLPIMAYSVYIYMCVTVRFVSRGFCEILETFREFVKSLLHLGVS